jgi:tRNA(Ile)-lysidine synthase
MKSSLYQKFIENLLPQLEGERPLLVGFSGGPDSRALVELLFRSKKQVSAPIHLAHIDHGWRDESAEEARYLKAKAEEMGFPFHLHVLNSNDFTIGNKENAAREYRLKFFCDIYQQINAQALLLAHQQDEQAETILKRIFEGAGLAALSGMKESCEYNGMKLIRPLLSCSKAEILKWLDHCGIQDFVCDETNYSRDYLRGKMRVDIIPYLEERFGKNIASSICALGSEAQEISIPLNEIVESHISKVNFWKYCVFLEIDVFASIQDFARYCFLKKLFLKIGIAPTRKFLILILNDLDQKKSAKTYSTDGFNFYLEKQGLFIVKSELLSKKWLCDYKPIAEGREDLNEEAFKINEGVGVISNWREAAQGVFSINFPVHFCSLSTLEECTSAKIRKKLLKRYSSFEVPIFMRSFFPFLIHNDELIHEFLTGFAVK